MNDAIRRIVIAGGGSAGWMTAAAFANRVMTTLNCKVTLVESEEIGTVGVGEATVPPIRLFNKLTYGIDEADLLRHIQGTFKWGIRFENWTRLGHSYYHVFGPLGRRVRGELIPFHHLWLRARQLGDQSEIHEYSLAAMAAAAGRFTTEPMAPSARLPDLAYAYHFDASLYAAYLRRFAEERGVRRVEGRIADVKLRANDGFIEALSLADGREVTGDFFIDCTGFRALLIGQALGSDYEDWSGFLPCDRAVAVPARNHGPRRPFTRAIARPHGWQWQIPLQHRSGNGYVYCSRYCSDDEATDLLLRNLEGEALAEPQTLRFTTGRRRQSWIKNCVALGLAQGFLEPLESTSLYFIHDGLLRLLSLFPDLRFEQSRIDLFNELTNDGYEHTRNFLVLHYWANQRRDAPFWVAARNMDIPESLRRRTEAFRDTAHATVKDAHSFNSSEGLFGLSSWVQVMLSQGIKPRGCHPLMAGTPDDGRLHYALSRLRKRLREAVERMPSHDAYIAQYCAAKPDN